MLRYLIKLLFFFVLFSAEICGAQDDALLGFVPKQPPCPEGAGFVPPGWLGSEDPLTTGCVWLKVPEHLRAELPEPPLTCFLDESFEMFEVWSNCNPFFESCESNCRDLQIIDGIATSPPSLAGRGEPLIGSDVFAPIKPFFTNQRVINQVIASCGFEGELWYAQLVPMPPPPKPPGPECSSTSNFFDGQGGRLWKPRSDNTGQPVFLRESSYRDQTNPEIFNGNNDFIGNGRFRTISNGNRLHWDVPLGWSGLDRTAPLTIRFPGNECLTVTNPDARED